MKRTTIADKIQYIVGKNGLKRIARARNISMKDKIKLQAPHQQTVIRQVKNPKAHILVVLQSVRGVLNNHAIEMLYVAQALADADTAVVALVFGAVEEDQIKRGADRVLMLDKEAWNRYQPLAQVKLIEKIATQITPEHIIFAEDEFGSELSRMLACESNWSFAGGVSQISKDMIICPTANCTMQQAFELPKIMSLQSGVSSGELEFECEALSFDFKAIAPRLNKNNPQSIKQQSSDDMDLIEADFICSAGNGVANFSKFFDFAKSLGAVTAGSRVVVDNDKLPRDRQVGATGVSVSSGMYVALGISGAIQHLQGITECQKVVAVNTDASAPMIRRADLSIIHDVDEVMTEVINELKQGAKV